MTDPRDPRPDLQPLRDMFARAGVPPFAPAIFTNDQRRSPGRPKGSRSPNAASGIPKRVEGILYRHRLTLDDTKTMTDEQLLSLPNFGKACLAHVRQQTKPPRLLERLLRSIR